MSVGSYEPPVIEGLTPFLAAMAALSFAALPFACPAAAAWTTGPAEYVFIGARPEAGNDVVSDPMSFRPSTEVMIEFIALGRTGSRSFEKCTLPLSEYWLRLTCNADSSADAEASRSTSMRFGKRWVTVRWF